MSSTLRALALFFLVFPCRGALSAQSGVSTTGCEFWLAAPGDDLTADRDFGVYLHAEEDATVRIHTPLSTWDQTVNVSAGGWTLHYVDPALITNDWPGFAVPLSVRITSDRPIRVLSTAGSAWGYSQDANPVLPVHMLGTRYHVQALKSDIYEGFVVVIATQDGTDVTVTPTVTTTSGNPAGVPATWTLNAGENLVLKSPDDLTGTLVESTAPVAVMGGHDQARIPDTCVAADHVFHYALPDHLLDTIYPIMPVPSRDWSLLQVVATQDDTEVTWRDTPMADLDEGGSLWFPIAEAGILRANRPISAVVFQVGSGCQDSLAGDPAMIPVLPWGSMHGEVGFMTYWLGMDAVLAYIDVVVDSAGRYTTRLDGETLPAERFKPLGNGWYGLDTFVLGWGAHRLASEGPYSAHAHGMGWWKSFGYPLGSPFPQSRVTTVTWCPGSPLWLSAPKGREVLAWSNGSAADSMPVSTAGTYWVQWTDGSDCGFTDTFHVLSNAPPPAEVQGLEPFCPDLDQSIQLTLDTLATFNIWSNGSTMDTVTFATTGLAWVAYSAEGQCWDTTFFLLEDDCPPPPPPPDTIAGPVGFPNAFTPNGDGINDTFGPMTVDGMTFAAFDLRIYDRWGRMVYATPSADRPWDGTTRGRAADMGSYRYVVSYTDRQGRSDQRVGEVLLLR
jgi:gliding motility-associated-like protein